MAWGWGKSIVLLHLSIITPFSPTFLYMPGVYCMQGPTCCSLPAMIYSRLYEPELTAFQTNPMTLTVRCTARRSTRATSATS